MILADKVAELRKKNGWSQEELAGRLGVSRQSVSKWESGASVPDLDKILKLSKIFGVSTDFLLKDSAGKETEETDTAAAEADSPDAVRVVTAEEAHAYMDTVRNAAGKIAAGVVMCILSPVVLIILGALSDREGGFRFPEAGAAATGMTVLLVTVAAAVTVFVFYGRKLERFGYLEKEPVELAYGVTGIVEKKKKSYEPSHGIMLMAGIGLCIVSAVPLMVLGALDDGGMTGVWGFVFCLVLVAAGVFLLVKTCMIFGSFQRLLEEGDYSREKKAAEKRNEVVNTVYWCIVTAVYLGWSFYTMDWKRTWIIWPCAGVLFGAVLGISNGIRKK